MKSIPGLPRASAAFPTGAWRRLACLGSGGAALIFLSLASLAQDRPPGEFTGPTEAAETEDSAAPALPAESLEAPAPDVAPPVSVVPQVAAPGPFSLDDLDESQRSIHQTIMWGGSAAVVFLLSVLLLARRRRVNRPRLFPITAPRLRFSAPHSGGNNAMISFGAKGDGD